MPGIINKDVMTPDEEIEFRKNLDWENLEKLEDGEPGAADSSDETDKLEKVETEEVEAKKAETDIEVIENPEIEIEEDPDPWAGVPASVKEMFDKLHDRVGQTESRIGGITNTLRAADKAAVDAKAATPPKKVVEEAAKSTEKWDQLIKDYPEWGEGLSEGIVKEIDERLKGIKGEGVTQEALDAAIKQIPEGLSENDMEMALLKFFQPKWEEKRKSPEFDPWLKEQSKERRDQFDSDFARDAIDVLDAFDEHMGGTKTAAEIAADRKARLKRSVDPKKKKAVAPKAEGDMTEAEFRQKASDEIFADT